MHVITITPQDIFQALSDPIRIRLVRLLAVTGEEACLCEFVDSLEEAQYKLSRHVKVLKQAGILSATKEGRWIYHRLVGEGTALKHLHEFVKALPDCDRYFEQDLKRFQKRLRLRAGGRCLVGIQTPHLSENAGDEPKQGKNR